jgi:hypothetical protein
LPFVALLRAEVSDADRALDHPEDAELAAAAQRPTAAGWRCAHRDSKHGARQQHNAVCTNAQDQLPDRLATRRSMGSRNDGPVNRIHSFDEVIYLKSS